ncbi:MAG: hypothetical protein GY769_02980 [bacterium]|nr:hypothetical protein [bacterium]
MSFNEGFEDLDHRITNHKLNVLVWGPSSKDPSLLAKREKIKDQIGGRFPYADVRFSEDPELDKLIDGAEFLSVPDKELFHLGACDTCIVLDASKGAGEEIAHFSSSKFAPRLFILTNEKYKDASSFPAALRENQNQVFYSESELSSCNLVERVIVHLKKEALRQIAW